MNHVDSPPPPTSLAERITAACVIEATARKPGNVHPGASFADTTYAHFITSAEAIGPILAESGRRGVGQAIHDAVAESRRRVGCNTHLGTILLLAPLAAVPDACSIAAGLPDVLRALDANDTRLVYAAIQLATPGGLGDAAEGDVAAPPPPIPLVAAMRPAADRDLVARQYINGFAQVDLAAARIEHLLESGRDPEAAIVRTFLELIREYPDTLIARKCGPPVAAEAARRAAAVLRTAAPLAASGTAAIEYERPSVAEFEQALDDFDRWLRSDGNRRNPGTTADLIAAALFVLLRDHRLPPDALALSPTPQALRPKP